MWQVNDKGSKERFFFLLIEMLIKRRVGDTRKVRTSGGGGLKVRW